MQYNARLHNVEIEEKSDENLTVLAVPIPVKRMAKDPIDTPETKNV